jgi:hypothetical protein
VNAIKHYQFASLSRHTNVNIVKYGTLQAKGTDAETKL